MFRRHGERLRSAPIMVCPWGGFPVALSDAAGPCVLDAVDAWRLPSGASLATYRHPHLEAEVLVGAVTPRLPPDMSVLGCVATVIDVRCLTDLGKLSFQCWWDDVPPGVHGGPNCGEGLDAITWRTGSAVVSLGTEDGELLRSRAERGQGLSRSLAAQLGFHTVEHDPNGLRVPFSNVPAGSVLRLQFLLAWHDRYSDESPSTWFAVEQDHADVVAQLVGDDR